MWDDLYNREEYVYGVQPNDFLKENIKILKSPVLSLAEGEGRNAVYLAEQGFDVLAVDSSETGLAKAQKLASLRNVNIRTLAIDLEYFEPEVGQYRAVISIFAHLPERVRKNLHKRLMNALAPGALIILIGYSKSQLGRGTGGPDNVDMLYDLSAIEEEFAECDILLSCYKETMVIEGTAHTGLANIVQFIGRKK